MRVLIVEDEKKVAGAVRRGLEAEGFAVDVALTGTDGLWMATENPYDVIAMNAASVATCLAGLPFDGPVGSVRMALIDGQWVVNPTFQQTEEGTFDVVVAGRRNESGVIDILMIEGEAPDNTWALLADGATAPTEETVAEGLEAAKVAIAEVIEFQQSALVYMGLAASVGAFLLWNRGVAVVGANAAGFTLYLLPTFGTLLAIAFLGESFHAFHALGIATIVAGVVLATRK